MWKGRVDDPGLGARLLALHEIVAKLPEKGRPAATADMAKREELSDERACELMRMLLAGAASVEPQIQLGFLRSLAHQ